MSRTMRLLNYCTKTDHSLPSAPRANLEEMHPNGCAQKNSTCSAEDLDHYKGPTQTWMQQFSQREKPDKLS